MEKIKILAFYKFTTFNSLIELQRSLSRVCEANRIFGSILISKEGLNGTIAGLEKNIDIVHKFMRELPGCADHEQKKSFSSSIPFLF